MSVYKTDYIVYGWKLPYDCISKEDLNKISEEYDKNNEYHIELLVDGMGGHYIVFGIVINQSDLFHYADNEFYWEFEDLDLSLIEKGKDELVIRYAKIFGQNSKYKGQVEYNSPKTFIFSHIY